mmetsp:Transcript_6587/g.16993  ORF Transcript_6587/g.16993 Transcript_6587/m.16993 type:complete len:433 (-) Transcript_6587:446-1744(-)
MILVHQNSHQLRNPKRWVRVVQLHGDFLWKGVEAVVLLLVPPHDVLERRGDHEVLLLEAELLPFKGLVIWVQHRGDGLGLLLLDDGGDVVARVEGLQVELLARLGRPEAQVDGARGLEARDRVVVGHGSHLLPRVPHKVLPALVTFLVDRHVPVELHWVGHMGPLDLPRVSEGEPVVRLLLLEAVRDHLAEHAVLVADAVAPGGQVEGGHGVEKAGGEPAQAAVTQRRVALRLLHLLQLVAEAVQGLLVRHHHAQVVKGVQKRAAHQKLHGEVVHPLRILVPDPGLRVVPPLDQAVPQRVRRREEGLPVVELVPAPRQSELHVVNNALLHRKHVVLQIGVEQRVEQVPVLLRRLAQVLPLVEHAQREGPRLGAGPRHKLVQDDGQVLLHVLGVLRVDDLLPLVVGHPERDAAAGAAGLDLVDEEVHVVEARA